MDDILIEPLTLYVTDRAKFNEKYATEPRTVALVNNIFLAAESRPQQAEHVAISIMGHQVHRDKKYDGIILQNGVFCRYSEYKVTCRRTSDSGELGKMSSIQINDVTQTIVDRYIHDQPLFVFPYFIDGHLAAMFSVDFSVIRPVYENFLNTNIKQGRASFGLALGAWIDHATVEFVHKDVLLVDQLPPMMQDKIYQTNPLQRSSKMSGIVKFPAGHQFERFGYNFDTDRVVSYARDPEGRDRQSKSGIKIGIISYSDKTIKKAASLISGLTCPAMPVPRKSAGTVKVTSAQLPQSSAPKRFVQFTQEITDDMTIADILRQFNVGTAKMEIITA